MHRRGRALTPGSLGRSSSVNPPGRPHPLDSRSQGNRQPDTSALQDPSLPSKTLPGRRGVDGGTPGTLPSVCSRRRAGSSGSRECPEGDRGLGGPDTGRDPLESPGFRVRCRLPSHRPRRVVGTVHWSRLLAPGPSPNGVHTPTPGETKTGARGRSSEQGRRVTTHRSPSRDLNRLGSGRPRTHWVPLRNSRPTTRSQDAPKPRNKGIRGHPRPGVPRSRVLRRNISTDCHLGVPVAGEGSTLGSGTFWTPRRTVLRTGRGSGTRTSSRASPYSGR